MSRDPSPQDIHLFEEHGGIWTRRGGILHRDNEYDVLGFDILIHMQRAHFWYLGRHRFLLSALNEHLPLVGRPVDGLRAIDLGGGCGGWLEYLRTHGPRFEEIALADSSVRALELARTVTGTATHLFQVDLLDLGWRRRWDLVFLLDVLEHLPDPITALQQVRECLTPNGLLFVTVPALMAFWSYNDEIVNHQRRYSKHDLHEAARQSGFTLVKARYFMFLLSPLLVASRLLGPRRVPTSRDEIRALLTRTHRVPSRPVNALLGAVFSLETPLGLRLSFPWGTSVLGVFQRRDG
jgi:2-polyprenyl-3-methyl-5-hydroxy-6-metoxy-1,4-benzoquinol methylase